MKDILQAISEYRLAKNWTEYQLAEKSGLPQSTISSWYRKKLYPTIPSLQKICEALGITIAELFNENDDITSLTKNQKNFLDKFNKLSTNQQNALLKFLDTLGNAN